MGKKQQWTFGERLADKIASFGGSWKFLISFGIFLMLWVLLNCATILWRPLDPYPFIFLNLMLSCVAAIQAPIIMMANNRQAAKDRQRQEWDLNIDIKSEHEIQIVSKKIDDILLILNRGNT